MKTTKELMLEKADKLLPSQDIVLRREQSIKQLGIPFNSSVAQLIVAMTDTFFIDGKMKAAEFINDLMKEKGL